MFESVQNCMGGCVSVSGDFLCEENALVYIKSIESPTDRHSIVLCTNLADTVTPFSLRVGVFARNQILSGATASQSASENRFAGVTAEFSTTVPTTEAWVGHIF